MVGAIFEYDPAHSDLRDRLEDQVAVKLHRTPRQVTKACESCLYWVFQKCVMLFPKPVHSDSDGFCQLWERRPLPTDGAETCVRCRYWRGAHCQIVQPEPLEIKPDFTCLLWKESDAVLA